MRIQHVWLAAATAVACFAASDLHAHVNLETPQAVAGSTYKAVLRVSHGCEGSPTIRVRVRIPDGMINVKPQPKPGWEISIVKGKLAQPIVDRHGNTLTETVREIAWSGGRLPDEYFDEFALRGTLPNTPGETIYFPTIQECESGVHRWIEIPAEGKSASDYKEPAPRLRLLPKAP